MIEFIYFIKLVLAYSVSFTALKAGCDKNGFSKVTCFFLLSTCAISWTAIIYFSSPGLNNILSVLLTVVAFEIGLKVMSKLNLRWQRLGFTGQSDANKP